MSRIGQIGQLKARLAGMDERFSEYGVMSAHDSRTYLAWSNSLIRALRVLGLDSKPAPVDHRTAIADAIAAGRQTRQDGAQEP